MNLRERIAALPRVKFLCGRDWCHYNERQLGFMWGKNLDAQEGEIVYTRWLMLRWCVYLKLDTRIK